MTFNKGDLVLFENEQFTYVEWDDKENYHVIENSEGNSFGVDSEEDLALVSEDTEEVQTEEQDEQIEEMSDAAATLQTAPVGDQKAKSAMMNDVMNVMAAKDVGEWIDFYNQMIGQIGQEAKDIPGDAADQNKDSISAKASPVGEEVAELFGSEELTEEFKEKTTVLFESAVNMKVKQLIEEEKEKLEESFQETLVETVEALEESVDHYLTYVAEQWIEENQLAVESSLKAEFAESFIHGIKGVLEDHYTNIPDDKVDVVEALAEKVDSLENELNEQIDSNIKLSEILEEYNKEAVFSESVDGLAISQVEKLRELAEGIEFTGDEEDYKKKLGILKEHHFKVKTAPSTLNEEVELGDDEETSQDNKHLLDPQMGRFVDAIARDVKNTKYQVK
jgi:hypothetical protein